MPTTKFDQPIEVTIQVRSRAPAGTPIPTTPLTRDEFVASWGAHPKDLEAVKAFARRRGLEIGTADAARRSVVVAGRPKALERAFAVRLSHHRGNRGIVHAVTSKIRVPVELRPIIEGVLGLDTRAAAPFRHFERRPVQKYPPGKTYTPKDIARLYGFPEHLTGRGQCIGLIEFGGGYRLSDIRMFCDRLKIKEVPDVTFVSVDGAVNRPTIPVNDSEVALDVEIACAVAPKARIVVYFAPEGARGLLDAITQAVHDRKNNPSVLSISYGGPEGPDSWSANEMQVIDRALRDAAVLGVTVCCASGDDGSKSMTGRGLAVNFPASSPHVLACGGTRVYASGERITREVVWRQKNGASGGGVSAVFPVPPWQTNARVRLRPGRRLLKGRGLPDVAGSASPHTGYHVLVDETWLPHLGGVSAVPPLWAGLIARLNEHLGDGRRIGYLTPLLYDERFKETCRDITSGSNGPRHYRAGVGWDACTGWGSPRGGRLAATLRRTPGGRA